MNPTKEKDLQALSKEIKLTKVVIDRENGKWFPCMRKDVSAEEALIVRLANRLIEMLSKVFASILSISNERPMTAQEEQRLARVAKELQRAYEITGQPGLAANMGEEVEAAKARAKGIKNQTKKEIEETKKAEQLVVWAKTPRHDKLRNLPLISRVFWTQHGANQEAARIRVRLAQENVQRHRDYPEILKPCLQELIVHKQVLVKHLKPGTREHLAVSREIQEHYREIRRMEQLEAAEAKVEHLSKKADLTWKVEDRFLALKELVSAKKQLAALITMNTPKHKSISQEIRRLEAEIRELSESLRRG